MIWLSLHPIGWSSRSAPIGLSATATGWRIIACPKRKASAPPWREPIGADGMHLLSALEQPEAPAELTDVASVHMLRQVWQQYYDLSDGKAKWRAGPQAGEAEGIIRSPYDPEARTCKKRETTMFGYKDHLTETSALETTEYAP